MNIQKALQLGREMLAAADSPALDARLLLEHLLQVGHTYLIAHNDQELTAAQEQDYRRLLQRAARREPIPYLTGRAPFFQRYFKVSPVVLIPRPETEQLVEEAVRWAAGQPALHLVDVGTGSGCIAITLAHQLPQAIITAVDISPEALALARQNAADHEVLERIDFRSGSLLDPVSGRPDLIVANLPYVTDHEWTMLDDGVKWYEPSIALQGGPDGLDLIRQLISQAAVRLAAGGAIFLEIGWQQRAAAIQTIQQEFGDNALVSVLQDLQGHDRIVKDKNEMSTKTVEIDPQEPELDPINQAAELLKAGKIVIYPTDTTYVFGANALDETALEQVFQLKRRPLSNPMHIIVPEIEAAAPYAELNDLAVRLAHAFLPGPLTIILPKKKSVPDMLTAGLQTVGIRIPDNKPCLLLARQAGLPMTNTTANLSGQRNPYSIAEIVSQFGNDLEAVSMILDQGELPFKPPSTIVDLTTKPASIIREGPVPNEQVLSMIHRFQEN